jgi:hypothetical protein
VSYQKLQGVSPLHVQPSEAREATTQA